MAAFVLRTATAAADPALDYLLNCQGCHRADGSGTPGSVPPLAGNVARFLRASGGREFLVQVPGVAQAALDDETLAALLNWMVARFDASHLPAEFRAYSGEEVAALRRAPLTEVKPIRDRLLAATTPTSDSSAGPHR